MRNTLREAFIQQSLDINTVDIMINSLSQSTQNQYNTAYKLWFNFCKSNNVNFFKASISELLRFLTTQFHNGASYATLNCFRSALSLIVGKEKGTNECVGRFLKGVFRTRPNFPKYQNTWNPSLVLDYLSNQYPNESLSLDGITKKLVTLLALSTGQRVQTLSLIKFNNISVGESSITITLDELIKTSAPNRANRNLVIPFFNEKPNICPAKTISDYMNKTREMRDQPATDRLILTIKKPIHNATAQSISRWVKQAINDSGIDVSVYTSHSTRHASTSAAHRAGVSVDVIKRAAGWTGSSLCFAKFYNLPLDDSSLDGHFARAVFNISE